MILYESLGVVTNAIFSVSFSQSRISVKSVSFTKVCVSCDKGVAA